MKEQIGFITKVIIASWILSVMIKYSDKVLTLAPTNVNALVIVFAPCLLMLCFLSWRYWLDKNNNGIEVSDK